MTRKQERKRARHARRVSRRKLLRRAGVAAISIFIPRMVHSEVVKPTMHPTWDSLLDHVGARRYPTASDSPIEWFGQTNGGLRTWVHDLVLRPHEPQPTLLLTGPTASGKSMFHEAMGLLLPRGGTVHVCHRPDPLRNKFLAIRGAWLMVVEGPSERDIDTFVNSAPKLNDEGRYLKWCLTHSRRIDRLLPNIAHFDAKPPAIIIPKPDLIRRLEDECDAFRRTLRQAA